MPVPHEQRESLVPRWDIFTIVNVGVVAPIGDTKNRLSFDLGGALSPRAHQLVIELSVADAQSH
ncbi:MAG TPA: hypothetical protein VGM39_23160 [Kofleriaceae bacterium]